MSVRYKDYYKVLGVNRNDDQDTLQKAFRKLARKYHPDVNKDPGAEAKFKELNEAYEVLKDPEKRAKYDRLGANWKAGDPFEGFSEALLFEAAFRAVVPAAFRAVISLTFLKHSLVATLSATKVAVTTLLAILQKQPPMTEAKIKK